MTTTQQPPKRRGRPPSGGRDPIRTIRVTDEDWQKWQQTAERAGVSLSAWARDILNRAVKRAARN